MSIPAIIKIKIRTGTSAEWTSANPILLVGELGLITDENLIIVGNGVNNSTELRDSFHRANQIYNAENIDTFLGALNTAIGNETTNRTNADNDLQDAIDSVVIDVTNLQGNVTTLQSDVITLQNELAKLDLTLTAKGQILVLDEIQGKYIPLQVGANGYVLTADDTNSSGISWSAIPDQSVALDDLTDVNINPSTLAQGDALQYDAINGEWINSQPIVYGDMFKSTYDVDNDGVVDSSEKMITIGRNSTGATLYQGTIVYISGSTGNRPNFSKAQANAESTSAGTFGVVVNDIADNSDGYVCTIGTLHNLDTRTSATNPFTDVTLSDGDTIYLHPTIAGYVTNVKPSAPNHLVYVGKVIRTTAQQGTIVYRIQNGYELKELHDVQANSPANNDTLYFDSSDSQWKTNQVENIIGIKKTSFMQFRKSGRWYNNGIFPNANANFTNQLAIRYVPFYIDRDVTITRLGINVTTIAPASSTCRIGIYTNDANTCQPSSRLVDSGTLALDTTGAKSVTGLSVALTKGLYWLAYVGSANSGTISGIGTNFIFDVKGMANIGAVGFAGFNQTYTYAPLPATAGTLTEINSGGTLCIYYYF